MKLWGVAMVRNEADIVEAFVRHNLTVLDGLSVVDHHSTDATPRILGELVAEGLPLTVETEARSGYYQDEIMTAAVRRALAATGADFAFALDGDEFVRLRSRELLERVLGGLPPRMHAALRWQTYVPDFAAPAGDVVALARSARRLATERHGAFKVVLGRHFLDTPDAVIVTGNHSVFPRRGMPEGSTAPQAALSTEVAALAHLPIRSRDQFVAKVVTNCIGRLATGFRYRADFQTAVAYAAIRRGEPLTPAFLQDQAVNWTVKHEKRIPAAEVTLVADPFLAAIELRHTPPAAADPLLRLLGVAEEIATELARLRGAPAAGADPA
jgi:hypothetical protein